MIRRLFLLAAALAATSAAAAVSVFAAALALFAFVRPWTGEAGAAAVVMGVFALVVALGGLLAAQAAKPKRPDPRLESASLMQRLTELAKARPMAAAGVAIAAAAMAARNPAVVGAVARAFFDGLNRPKPPKR